MSFNRFLLPVVALAAQVSPAFAGGIIADSTAQVPVEAKKPLIEALPDFTVHVHGTVRGKFEWEPDIEKARFEVRNARFSLSGNVTKLVSYKAEIDLSDEGSIKMLDAYGRIQKSDKGFAFTIGQMRVPFTIDAHRSPHQQYFANRSFLAKQVGNVRDVGACLRWASRTEFPIILEGGIFNGSGLTNQKNFWTSDFNCSAKAQFKFNDWNLVTSYQKTHPDIVDVRMFGAGVFYHTKKWHAEVEYLRKNYEDDAFDGVNTFDVFVCHDIATPRSRVFGKISPLVRWDFMSDHSDGKANDEGKLYINDYQRNRITGGVTFSLGTPFQADIRLNYEKYFYRSDATIGVSDNDKLVCEFMVRF